MGVEDRLHAASEWPVMVAISASVRVGGAAECFAQPGQSTAMIPLKDHNPTFRTPYVTFLLIAINTAVMIWLASLSPLARQEEVLEHGFIPARISQLSHPQVLEVAVVMEVGVPNPQFPPQKQIVKKIGSRRRRPPFSRPC